MQSNIIHYCTLIMMFLIGIYVSSYGPLIPLYSRATGKDQTQFSFIFFVRSVANISGAYMTKYIFERYSSKTIIIICFIMMVISLLGTLYSFSNLNLIVMLYISALANIIFNIIVIIISIKTVEKSKVQKLFPLIGFIFGVGAMFGPLLILITKLKTYFFLSFAYLIMMIIYLNLQLPKLSEQNIQHIQNTQNIENKNNNNTKVISNKTQLLLCIMMFLYATQQLGIASWIPTYAIKTYISSNQQSGFYSLIFWISNTIFRLLWIYVPIHLNQKIKIIIIGLFISTFLTIIFQSLEYYHFVCYFSPITSGILVSNLYSFLIMLPMQNGFASVNSTTSNLVLANSLGEGLLITPIGFAIYQFGPNSLMFILAFASFIYIYTYYECMKNMKKDYDEYELYQPLQMKQKVTLK